MEKKDIMEIKDLKVLKVKKVIKDYGDIGAKSSLSLFKRLMPSRQFPLRQKTKSTSTSDNNEKSN